MYFPAKKATWLSLIIWNFILFIILIYIFGGDPVGQQFITYKSIPGYIIGASIVILLLWISFRTGYQVKEELLIVRLGPFRNKINIKQISAIKNPNTSSALPLKIFIGKYDTIKITPKNKRKFIASLLAINPDIKIDAISMESNKK